MSTILALQTQHAPQLIMCGGDWNTAFSRIQSKHTLSLCRFCTVDNLTCVDSTELLVKFTYVIVINCTRSTIDHFIIPAYLCSFVDNPCVCDDIENQSDHLHICMPINLPVQQMHFNKLRQF